MSISMFTKHHPHEGSSIALALKKSTRDAPFRTDTKLRPKYIVRLARRFVTEMPHDVDILAGDIYPDISMIAPDRPSKVAESVVAYGSPPLQMATVMPARVPHVTVEIRDVANRELVTAIEVLSPTNKRGEGRREYLDKRQRILCSMAHLIEIDLLRSGQRVPMQKPLPPASYFVFLSRAERRSMVEIWPIQLSMRLPVISVPLLADDPEVTLDLQLALDTVYDALNYDLSLDYTCPPEIPLDGELAAWTNDCLRNAGLMH